MAAPLSRAVIQLPDFAEMAYKKSLADEERRLREEEKQERKVAQRQREADAFGVKQSYYEKSFALESGAKRVADEAYKLFQQAGIDYEKTGSEEAKIRMEKAAGQFNQVVGAGLAVSNSVNQEFETFKKNPSAFTAESQKIANQAYSDRKNIDFQPVIENGMVFINEKGKKVPITESIYFSANVQPGYNTLGLVPVDPATKYLDPRDYASLQVNNFKDTDGVRVDDGRNVKYNQSALTTKARSSYESDLSNNPSLMEAVILRHSTASSGNPPSPQQRANVIAEYNSNPELLKAAKDNYFKEVTSFIPQFMPAMQRGVAPQQGEPSRASKDLSFFLENTKGVENRLSDGRVVAQFDDPPIEDFSVGDRRYSVKRISFDKEGTPLMIIQDEFGTTVPQRDKNNAPNQEFNAAYKKALNEMKPYLSELRAFSKKAIAGSDNTNKSKVGSRPTGY
jgi:hypothetical protein